MLVTLRQIVWEVGTATNLDEALEIIVRRVKEYLPVDACAVYLFDVPNQHYVLMAVEGLNPASIGRVRLTPHEGLVGLVGKRCAPVNLKNAATHPHYHYFPETGEERYCAFFGMPLIYYREVLGVLVARKRAQCRFDQEEAAFLMTIAAPLARAIHDAAVIGDIDKLLSGERQEIPFIQGVQGAPGVAIGTIVLLNPLAQLESIPDRRVQDIEAEEHAFRTAVAAVQEELRASSERMAALPHEVEELLNAYVMMLSDPGLIADALQRIRAGHWAPGAWREVIAERVRIFEQLEDPYLQARAQDIRDLGYRILDRLQSTTPGLREYPERCILMGEEIGLAEIAEVPVERLAGMVCLRGSALSHTAVLSRALGVPCVMSLTALPLGRLDGCEMVVDGYRGRIYIQPSPAVLAAYQRRISGEKALSTRLNTLRDLPAETPDGVRLSLYINTGLNSDYTTALNSGAEGVGLYRTEFSFLGRETFPVEDEQYQLYRQVLEAFAPRPVTLRTLDVGGDKPLPYLPAEGNNPFLGCRGIRFTLDHPEIFLIQLRAMLRAAVGLNNLQVLFPLISRVSEVDEARGLLTYAYHQLLAEGLAVVRPRVGVMIEVPSAVYLAGALVERVDFLSVGTNDLTQYLLAVDRSNAAVAKLYDSLHPAVLHAIYQVVKRAHQHGKPVSICGEMAGDPAAALLLLGMGIDALSVNPTSLPRVKWVVRSFTQHQAQALLQQAFRREDEFAIHCLLNGALEEAGLGVLVRTE